MTIHDDIANKLANKFNTSYKSDKGIDLVLPRRVIEVETKRSGIFQGIKQVEKSDKARYLAVSKPIEKATIEATKGTGIGVMTNTGRIIKRAGRK